MSTVELTKENFDQVVSDNDFVLIDFWASCHDDLLGPELLPGQIDFYAQAQPVPPVEVGAHP
ncbi:hypothetical protein ABZ609_35115, partial [Streptomyces rubiginosohelvolus]